MIFQYICHLSDVGVEVVECGWFVFADVELPLACTHGTKFVAAVIKESFVGRRCASGKSGPNVAAINDSISAIA